ncbi:unnamed protein product, partial [Clavelina lepadiformis]
VKNADRVKRQWNNDVAAEYSNHREVTIQLTNDNKREDIYRLLKGIKIPIEYIEGIIQKPGKMVNITVDRKNNAIRLADLLRKMPEVKSAIAHGDERIDLTIRWVPIDYPQRHLDEILEEFEIQGPAQLGVDKYGIKDGRRVYKVNKKTMERHQLPSYLYLGKIRCANRDTNLKNAPKRSQADTNNPVGQDLPMTTAQNLESDEEEPSPSPSENHKEVSAHAETDEQRRAKERSGWRERRSRAKMEPQSEESPELDSDERPSEREESESRGNKRKNISGDSNEDKEKTEVRREGNGNCKYDFSDWAFGSSGLIGCRCGKVLPVKRSKDSRNSLPDFDHPIYCAGCTAVFARCNCTKFSILRLNDRLKPFQCGTCEYTYEPNPDDLNSTVN